MKIVAVVGVMDERELLPDCVRHLYDIGVDEVVVRDAGSTDGSLDWAQAHQGPRLRLVPVGEDEKTQPAIWHARECEIADATRADWVLHLDADEFWLPATGRLPCWHRPPCRTRWAPACRWSASRPWWRCLSGRAFP